MSRELPEGVVSVLFSGVVGSTDLTMRRGDEIVQDMLSAHRELAPQQVGTHGGQSRTST